IFKEEDEIKTGDFPQLKEGDEYIIEALNIEEGITKAPTRYSEATLVKKLESEGIGRPSTYASIVETLKTREYAELIEKRFYPTFLGYEVKNEILKNFQDIMNVKFTANMEKELDKIEDGNVEWIELLRNFYNSLEEDLGKYESEIEKLKNRKIISDVMDSKGKPMLLKTGRFGKYLISETDQEEKVTLKGVAINPEEIEKGHIFVNSEVEKLKSEKKGILTDYFTENGKRYLLKKGRFGEYLESEDYENDEKRMPLPIPIKQKLKKNAINEVDGIIQINDDLLNILEEENKIKEEAGVCEKCGSTFEIKMGRFGKFLACTGYPECKNIKAIPKNKKSNSKKTTKKKTSKKVEVKAKSTTKKTTTKKTSTKKISKKTTSKSK
ncbi:MAG: topoisomerase DNA-binding C4 zinc finger domain-containing protein, partial [Leptotrichiaceae bacterium]|nr:topoisomerase DNA-binding C4 zinc finger domain-containing protein [Leptotrichiaceae bacterium]